MPKFFEKLDKLDPAFDAIYNFFMLLCKLLLVADVIITCYSVFTRYITILPPAVWAEEIILALMAYMVVLSASLAIRNNAHIRMSIFDNKLPRTLLNCSEVFIDFVIIVLAVIMIVVGWKYAITIGSKGTFTTIPALSRFWKYFPVPVAGVAMLLFEIEVILKHIKAFWVKEENK